MGLLQLKAPLVTTAGYAAHDSWSVPLGVNYRSATSNGCTVFASMGLNPSLVQKWSILSVGFQAALGIAINGIAVFGRLAPIYCGVFLEGGPSPGPAVILPPAPLSDPSLTVKLWDPNTDPMPPISDGLALGTMNPGELLQVSAAVQLPVPYPLRSGARPPVVGMWIMQSLLGTPNASTTPSLWQLVTVDPSYTFEIDDGLG